MRAYGKPLLPMVLLCSLGCGGGAPETAIVTSEFTAEHAAVFEDGMDFVEDPTTLEGRWREDWSNDLEQRVIDADLISVVTITYVRTDTDLDRRNTYRIVAEIGRNLFGKPPEQELTLTVREGETGFGTIEGNERRILTRPFIAFIKWYRADDTRIRPHWHLAPASNPVVRRTEYLIENRRDVPDDSRETVVIHEN